LAIIPEKARVRERQEIANKLKERERRRQLEKEVRQELIDKGEIMQAAGRSPIPREIVDAVYARDGGRCVYCGSKEKLQIDHIIPFSKGGADTLENFQILCQKCNLEKSNKIG
jgi:5-methylcytosine-specific restriction endonuclease McrA